VWLIPSAKLISANRSNPPNLRTGLNATLIQDISVQIKKKLITSSTYQQQQQQQKLGCCDPEQCRKNVAS